MNDRDHDSRGRFKAHNKCGFTSGLANGLQHSRLPKGMGNLRKQLTAYRRRLEVAARAGTDVPLTVLQDGLVASAITHERRRRLAERWLAERWDKGDATTAEIDRLQAIMGEATDARERAVSALLGPEARPIAPEATSTAQAAAAALLAFQRSQHQDLTIREELAAK